MAWTGRGRVSNWLTRAETRTHNITSFEARWKSDSVVDGSAAYRASASDAVTPYTLVGLRCYATAGYANVYPASC
jgi:hypothetical protein